MTNLTPIQRMIREDRREEAERRKLSDYAWDLVRRVEQCSTPQLETAAKLKDHVGELGTIARAAERELERRSSAGYGQDLSIGRRRK